MLSHKPILFMCYTQELTHHSPLAKDIFYIFNSYLENFQKNSISGYLG